LSGSKKLKKTVVGFMRKVAHTKNRLIEETLHEDGV